VQADQVPRYLGELASLFDDVERAADGTGLTAFAPIKDHLATLRPAIFPVHKPFNDGVAVVAPDSHAMQALKTLSDYLHQKDPDVSLPDEETVADLKGDVQDLIRSVSEADLPPEAKRPMLHRLAEMLEALEHLDVSGPEAVRLAAEALAASAVIYGTDPN
jgi:hypothetical protein